MSGSSSYFRTLLIVVLVASPPLAEARAEEFRTASLRVVQADGTITGTVTNRQGDPLPSATVRLVGTSLTARADQNGRFTLTGVPVGSHQLRATYVGYEEATVPVELVAGRTVSIAVRLTAQAVVLEGLTVMGELSQGQAKSLQQQKSAINVQNVVAQEQIQRFPDQNASEAVARVPGVSVQREEGEGETIQIRGLASDLNAVAMNGQRAPSSKRSGGEAEGRPSTVKHVQARLVQSITVTKALTPDLDGDAIGGRIDFRLAQAPERGKVDFELGYGSNDSPERPGPNNSYGHDRYNVRGILGERFLDSKLGILLSGSYEENNRGSINRSISYAENNPTGANFGRIARVLVEDRDYDQARQGAVANLDYEFTPLQRIHLSATYNGTRNHGIRRRSDIRSTGGSAGRNEATLRNNRYGEQLGTVELGGDHQIGSSALDYSFFFGHAENNNDPFTNFRFRRVVPTARSMSNDQLLAYDLDTDFGVGPFALRDVERDARRMTEEDRAASANLRIPFMLSGMESNLKVGGKLWRRDSRDDRYYATQTLVKGKKLPLETNQYGPLEGILYTDGRFRDLPLSPEIKEDPRRGAFTGYNADELISAGYAMGTFNLSDRFTVLTGARVEHTATDLSSPSQPGRVAEERYTNVLPSLHLTFRPSESNVLRFAAWTGLARPGYREQAPVRYENEDGDSIVGNPELEPTSARNLDLIFENYSGALGLFSVGAFAKFLDNQILRTVFPFGDGLVKEMSVNGEGATIYGLEFAVNRRFTFFPDALWFLRPFGMYATYSYARTESTTEEGRSLPYPNTPSHTANAALTYDSERAGLSATFSTNYKTSRLDGIGVDEYTDRYYNPETRLDFSLSKRLLRGTELFVEANNLLDTEERKYIGHPSESYSRFAFIERYGRTLTFGFRYGR